MTTDRTWRLAPNRVIVFEGLDKAGKSTQMELLKSRLDLHETTCAHMPSGSSPFTQLTYAVLENVPPGDPLARQLNHLACHSENMPELVRASRQGSLLLDRWWWSTVAYGWHGSSLGACGLSEQTFRSLIDTIWRPITASRIFLFLNVHEDDPNNNDAVAQGYRELAARDPRTVIMPAQAADEAHEHIMAILRDEKHLVASNCPDPERGSAVC